MFIRTLFIWLLVLAVPVQGAAAATMAFCGPNHHGGSASVQQQSATPAEHAHHGASAATAHEHDKVAASVDDVSAASVDSAASPVFSKASTQKCSACASCCSLGAILNSVLAVPEPIFSPTVFSTVVPSVDAFAADGPDRPPRYVLA
jgi:hypothetical protein